MMERAPGPWTRFAVLACAGAVIGFAWRFVDPWIASALAGGP